jgi:trehalose synthase
VVVAATFKHGQRSPAIHRLIAGNVGGIRCQIQNGVNGFLVSSVGECTQRIVELLKDRRLRKRIGRAGKETVRKRFLMPRYLEQHLDLFSSFESSFRHVGWTASSRSSPKRGKYSTHECYSISHLHWQYRG